MTQASRSSQPAAKVGCVKAGASCSTIGSSESIMAHMGGPPFLGASITLKDTRNPLPLQPPRRAENCPPVQENLRKSSDASFETPSFLSRTGGLWPDLLYIRVRP